MQLPSEKRHYGFFTTVAMIVGIVVGSGIFYKTDNILAATQGSVALGVLVFCIAALAIVFGCLTLSNLAALTDKPGGIIAYCGEFVNKKLAGAYGWFQTFIYYPTLTAVISWVVGMYIGVLFGWKATLEMQMGIGFVWFLICFAFNIASARAGGGFQNVSVIIKMIPLLLLGVAGVLLGDPVAALKSTVQNGEAVSALGWVAAIGPIAFSFDGWVISTAIGFEVRQAKKALPRALVTAPLCILLAYLLYFVGVSSYVGVDQVMALKDESVALAANNLLGGMGAKVLVTFVVISVMGTVNGVVLGGIRLPYSLALENMLPGSEWLKKVNEKNGMPINSGIFSMLVALVWWVIHYLTMKYNLLPNSDVSEIAIAMSYLLYLVLYYQVFKLWRAGRIQGVHNGVIFPVLAAVGSLFILMGALQNPLFLVYVAISLLALFAGYAYLAGWWRQTRFWVILAVLVGLGLLLWQGLTLSAILRALSK